MRLTPGLLNCTVSRMPDLSSVVRDARCDTTSLNGWPNGDVLTADNSHQHMFEVLVSEKVMTHRMG